MKLKWWVYSTAIKSKHKSRVGPFETVTQAANWVEENRDCDEWMNIHITGRRVTETPVSDIGMEAK
jgi:hypothetical protein